MTDVFETPTKGEETPVTQVSDLVGEDKKFKTVEDLAKGKLEADSYIEQLKEENRIAREKLGELEGSKSKDETVSELLRAVREHQKDQQGDVKGDNQVNDEDLSERIKAIMQGETEAQTKAQNRSEANQSVLDKVGGSVEAAQAYLAERAKQLGMTVERLRELGEISPSAFAKLVDADSSTVSKGITGLTHQSSSNHQVGPQTEIDGHKTKAYYDALKKEIGPAKYWNDHKIQGQYAKDAMFLRERFNQ
jgi:hypothetical protein